VEKGYLSVSYYRYRSRYLRMEPPMDFRRISQKQTEIVIESVHAPSAINIHKSPYNFQV